MFEPMRFERASSASRAAVFEGVTALAFVTRFT
jgi:hypothetical protein